MQIDWSRFLAIVFGAFTSHRRTQYKHFHNPALNRSRHWPFAKSYKHAREMSPTPWTPVR